MSITFKIHPQIYPIPLRVIVGDDEYVNTITQKYYKGATFPDRTGFDGYVTMVTNRGYNEVVMVLEDVSFTRQWYGVLAHECVHVAKFVLETTGIPFSIENDESVAYITGWAMKNILSKLYKHEHK